MAKKRSIFDIVQSMGSDLQLIQQRYEVSADLTWLQNEVKRFIEIYHKFPSTGDRLIVLADNFIRNGDQEAGFITLHIVEDSVLFANFTVMYIRLAEYYIRHEQTEKARVAFHKLLNDGPSNLDQSAEYNDLADELAWLEQTLKMSLPRSKSSVSVSVNDIFFLPKDEVLSALSEHIQDRSSYGEDLRTLNQWERIFFYVDELCMEINLGGFEGYLYYHGHHFRKAFQAIEEIGAQRTIALLQSVEAKFPRKRVPRSMDRIQDVMDKIEEAGMDFEAEDDLYYESVEKELLSKLTEYVMTNQRRFR